MFPMHTMFLKFLRAKNARTLSYFHSVGEEPLRPLTLGVLLEDIVKKKNNSLAVISRFQNQKLTFTEVLSHADRFAAGLIKTGLQSGDRVGIWAPNLIEWYITYMACARAGFVMVALNPAYQSREIEYCIKKVGVKGIVCGHEFKSQNYYEILTAVVPELPESRPGKLENKRVPSLRCVVTIADEPLRGTYNYNEIIDMADPEHVNVVRRNQDNIKTDDPCNILFSSGTTGLPKAAVISHFSVVNNGFYVGKRNGFDKKHHVICTQIPLFHAFATVGIISASLNYGSTVVLPSPSYDPNKSLETLKEEKCTIIYGTPTMYIDLVKLQKERREQIFVETAMNGGAPCSPHLFKEMVNVLGVKRVKSLYGLSECGGAFQSLYDEDEYKATSTVGHLHEHMEAKVVDADGEIVPVGTPGELYIRSYSTMMGYWNDEDKTKEAIAEGNWLRTGDQFVMDENGYGRVVGRFKEMINRGGENIVPGEIEDFLSTHPSILEIYVIGLPHERLGEEVCACVRLKEDCTLTLEEIRNFCKGNIAHFKIPSVLKIVDSFPRTTSGKIQKFKLVEEVQSFKLVEELQRCMINK